MKILIAVIVTLLTFQTHAKKIALVVGNSDYPMKLINGVNDANSIAASLKRIGFEVILRKNISTAEEFHSTVIGFSDNIEENDVVLFFYAGHAIQSNGMNYLLPLASRLERLEDLDTHGYKMSKFFEVLSKHRTKANLIILDACRNNPIELDLGRSSSQGLAPMNPPVNSLVAFSTRAGATAAEGSGVNSPYTTQLLKFIETPNVPVQNIFMSVRAAVLAATNGVQTPNEYTYLLENIYLNGQNESSGTASPEPRAPKTFSELRTNVFSLVGKKPIIMKGKTVIPGKFEIKDDCSFSLEKEFSFYEGNYTCKTTGNLKTATLNYYANSSSDFYPAFNSVETNCYRGDWEFYKTKTSILYTPFQVSREVYDSLAAMQVICKR